MTERDSQSLQVRINGVLSDRYDPGREAGETAAHTSMSVFYQDFHLLVDAGAGVANSLQKAVVEPHQEARRNPDAILITNAKKQHISNLPYLIGKSDGKTSPKIYCTEECAKQITEQLLPSLKGKESLQFNYINPNNQISIGPISVLPIAAGNSSAEDSSTSSPSGSVIFVIKGGSRKIIAGWDFLRLLNAEEDSIFWNPDLLVLGTETYNEHPETGMISVSEGLSLIKRWNAKLCYVLHYSGEKDRENAKNQWHRGPEGPLSANELQKVIDDYLRIVGQEGKFVVKVAKEGMVWNSSSEEDPAQDLLQEGPIGPKIDVEALAKYVFSIEKMPDGKLIFTVEDNINRLTSEFVNPKATENSLHADPLKGKMMLKGPELNMTVFDNNVKIDIAKGKKAMFANDLPISEKDSQKLRKYLLENFG
jgi:beta-lactamase family protein